MEEQNAKQSSKFDLVKWPIIGVAISLGVLEVLSELYMIIGNLRISQYWTAVRRSSETTLRLSALHSDLLQESGRLMAIAGTSGDDGAELHVWTSETSLAQLHGLLEEFDLDQLEKHIGRLRDAGKRLHSITRQIDQSWDHRVFYTLQSCFSRLKAVNVPWQSVRSWISSVYTNLLIYKV